MDDRFWQADVSAMGRLRYFDPKSNSHSRGTSCPRYQKSATDGFRDFVTLCAPSRDVGATS